MDKSHTCRRTFVFGFLSLTQIVHSIRSETGIESRILGYRFHEGLRLAPSLFYCHPYHSEIGDTSNRFNYLNPTHPEYFGLSADYAGSDRTHRKIEPT